MMEILDFGEVFERVLLGVGFGGVGGGEER